MDNEKKEYAKKWMGEHLKNAGCSFDIEIREECGGTREFNALDHMFFFSDPAYKDLCNLCGADMLPPSKLMEELKKIVGKPITFSLNGKFYAGILEFSEEFEIILSGCREVDNDHNLP